MLGLGQLQGDVAQVRRFLENKTLRIGGIVLTQVEKNNVHRELEDQLRAMFGALVFAAKIPRSIKVEEAHARHESVLTYAPKSIGAVAYKALAREITAHGQREADRHDASRRASCSRPRRMRTRPRPTKGRGATRRVGPGAEAPRGCGRRRRPAAASEKVEGRRLYLSEDVHFRLRMLAYQRGQKISEVAQEVLDRGLPRYDVNRVG